MADLVNIFVQQWLAATKSVLDNTGLYNPDVSYLIEHIIEAVKDENDVALNLAMMAYNDIAAITHFEATQTYQVEKYNALHVLLANITVSFGNALIERLRLYGIYRGGFFHYHFAGMVGENILVEQDALLAEAAPDNGFAQMKEKDDDPCHTSSP